MESDKAAFAAYIITYKNSRFRSTSTPEHQCDRYDNCKYCGVPGAYMLIQLQLRIGQGLRARPSTTLLPLRTFRSPVRALTCTAQRMQDAFHSQSESHDSSSILSSIKAATVSTPQTLTEKIVQKYSLGLAPSKVVQAGDYVTIAPHHCMTVCSSRSLKDIRISSK